MTSQTRQCLHQIGIEGAFRVSSSNSCAISGIWEDCKTLRLHVWSAWGAGSAGVAGFLGRALHCKKIPFFM